VTKSPHFAAAGGTVPDLSRTGRNPANGEA